MKYFSLPVCALVRHGLRHASAKTKKGVISTGVLAIVLCGTATKLRAQSAVELTSEIDSAKTVVLANHHPLWANVANDAGTLDANAEAPPMTLVLARSAQQEQALQTLLAQQLDPHSPQYHHWLTPVEFGKRFGVAQADVDRLRSWLESQGLHVNWVAPGRNFIGFGGSAGAVGRAFQTELHTYRVNGELKTSVASDPVIPAALATAIKAVHGLFTIENEAMHGAQTMLNTSPQVTLNSTTHFLGPWDFATIYDLPSTNNPGGGTTIGIVGRSRTDFADFNNFESLTSTDFQNPTEVVPTAFGGIDPGPAYTTTQPSSVDLGDQLEATLDVVRAGSVAKGANLLLVVTTSQGGDIGADAQYLMQTTPVPAQVMNISFGACEQAAGSTGVSYWDTIFQQAAAEGISTFVSSGDSGAAGCDEAFVTPPTTPLANSTNYICSSSYATCVGGTEFNDTADPSQYWDNGNGNGLSSALSYIPEGAWNEPLNSKSQPQVASSGGGVSLVVPTPSWQQGLGVPSARTGRYTPDLSFSASGHDGYFACFAAAGASCVANAQGEYYFEDFFGTSAAAPSMAGITALLDAEFGIAQGNLNPGLYALAASSSSTFHDVAVVTSGVTNCSVNTPSMCNNSIPGMSGLSGGQAGYLITNGYDEVTGLGSLDVASFLNNYAGTQTAPAMTLTLSSSNITTAQYVYAYVNIAQDGLIVPTGSFTIVGGGYNSGTQSDGVVIIPANTLAVGTDTLTATYTPDAAASRAYSSATATATVTVTKAAIATPILTVQGLQSIVTAQPLQLTVYINGPIGDQNPSGTLTATFGSFTSAPATLHPNVNLAYLLIPAGVLTPGTDVLTINYVPDAASTGIYTSASTGFSVAVSKAPVSTPAVDLTLSANPISQAQSLTVSASVGQTNSELGYTPPTGSFTLTGGGYSSSVIPLNPIVTEPTAITIPAGALTVGNDQLTVTYTPDAASSAFYTSANATALVQVTQPSFTISGATVSVTPGAGSGNISTITIAPAGGFVGSVTLRAEVTQSPTGAQDLPTFSFGSTGTVNVTGSSPVTATLTISTTASTTALLKRTKGQQMPWMGGGGAVLACGLLLGIPARRRRWRTMLVVIALLGAMTAGVSACGGGSSGGGGGQSNPGTTAGPYVITITGTSGSITQTGTVNLTVQ